MASDRAVKIRNWGLAVSAVLAAGLAAKPIWDGGKNLIAQEAATAAEAVIDEKLEPLQEQQTAASKKLVVIEGYLRRSEDREETRFCLQYSYQDLNAVARAHRCERESKARWDEWMAYDDSVSASQ